MSPRSANAAARAAGALVAAGFVAGGAVLLVDRHSQFVPAVVVDSRCSPGACKLTVSYKEASTPQIVNTKATVAKGDTVGVWIDPTSPDDVVAHHRATAPAGWVLLAIAVLVLAVTLLHRR